MSLSGTGLAQNTVSRRERIEAEVVKAALAGYESDLVAVVLTGSLARGEATWAVDSSRWVVLGDAEFILVFRQGTQLPRPTDREPLQARVESALDQQGISCSVALDSVFPDYFRRLPPRILSYELRTCGRVVWGDQTVLSLVPAFGVWDILLEDAWRLLANRTIEQFTCDIGRPRAEVIGQRVGEGDGPPRLHYRLAKMYLDMATSFLVFAGAYEPTYRRRAQRLRELAGASGAIPTAVAGTPANMPFSLDEFADRVSEFTRFKLGEAEWPVDRGTCGSAPSLAEAAWDYARRLWRWELQHLLASASPSSDALPKTATGGAVFQSTSDNRPSPIPDAPSFLMVESLMRRQTSRERMRGWLYVARASGWLHGWRYWPRWLWLGRRASPRYCVYRAASEFAFARTEIEKSQTAQPASAALPRSALLGPERSFNSKRVCSWLPIVPRRILTEASGERGVAEAILWNYEEFLAGTRA